MQRITLPAWGCVGAWRTEDGLVKEVTCDNEKVARDFIAIHIESALIELDTRYSRCPPEKQNSGDGVKFDYKRSLNSGSGRGLSGRAGGS